MSDHNDDGFWMAMYMNEKAENDRLREKYGESEKKPKKEKKDEMEDMSVGRAVCIYIGIAAVLFVLMKLCPALTTIGLIIFIIALL